MEIIEKSSLSEGEMKKWIAKNVHAIKLEQVVYTLRHNSNTNEVTPDQIIEFIPNIPEKIDGCFYNAIKEWRCLCSKTIHGNTVVGQDPMGIPDELYEHVELEHYDDVKGV